MDPRPLHGATLVLIDEDLNDAAVRFYNEGEAPRPSGCGWSPRSRAHARHFAVARARRRAQALRLRARTTSRPRVGARRTRCAGTSWTIVDPDQDPWKEFSRVVGENVQERLRLKAERQQRIRRGPAGVG